MSEIYLLSCVKSKLSYSCPAQDMYVSALFKKMLKYAQSKNPDYIFILSAKYGLLGLSDIIEPYEKTLNKMGKHDREEWAEAVLEQLKDKTDVKNDKFTFLAGQKYRENLIPSITHYSLPMEGMPFGQQLKWLGEQSYG
ncbi:MAG: hypothetical protein COB84_10610 [Rhodobacteraceae bacterium]|nr:MAG: hypothetical protein COB84_10610 [Paracoccaceae bacterium]